MIPFQLFSCSYSPLSDSRTPRSTHITGPSKNESPPLPTPHINSISITVSVVHIYPCVQIIRYFSLDSPGPRCVIHLHLRWFHLNENKCSPNSFFSGVDLPCETPHRGFSMPSFHRLFFFSPLRPGTQSECFPPVRFIFVSLFSFRALGLGSTCVIPFIFQRSHIRRHRPHISNTLLRSPPPIKFPHTPSVLLFFPQKVAIFDSFLPRWCFSSATQSTTHGHDPTSIVTGHDPLLLSAFRVVGVAAAPICIFRIMNSCQHSIIPFSSFSLPGFSEIFVVYFVPDQFERQSPLGRSPTIIQTLTTFQRSHKC